MAVYKIEFQPLGRRGRCRDGQSVTGYARELGIGINYICGVVGTCQSCKVRLTGGAVSAPTSGELDAFSPE